jgi:hypothetical protein
MSVDYGLEIEYLRDSLLYDSPPCEAIRVDRFMMKCGDLSVARVVNCCSCKLVLKRVVFVCQYCLDQIKHGDSSCEGCSRRISVNWRYA